MSDFSSGGNRHTREDDLLPEVEPQEGSHQITDAVAIVSGGMDSITLLYKMVNEGLTPHVLSFNYGQRHKKELGFAKHHADRLGLPHDIIDLSSITHLISNSALTSGIHTPIIHEIDPSKPKYSYAQIDVPEGHYAEDSMTATVVPNRNMMMISIAAAVAINEGARVLGVGVHAGDHFVYPDCRPGFITKMKEAILVGNEGFHMFDFEQPVIQHTPAFAMSPAKYAAASSHIFGDDSNSQAHELTPIYAPFVYSSKADIAYLAISEYGIPLEETWSCYKGDLVHCGRCGTCVERLEAISFATKQINSDHGVELHDERFTTFDRTVYADSTYWMTVPKPETSKNK